MSDPKELWKEVEELQGILQETVGKKGAKSPDAIRAIQAFRNKMQEYNDLVNHR